MLCVRATGLSSPIDYCLLTILSIDEQLQHYADGIEMVEWDLISTPKIMEVLEWNLEDQRDISYLDIYFVIRRKSGFYLTHVISLVFLLMIMGWATYHIFPHS